MNEISKPTSYECEVLVKNEALNPFKPIVMAWLQVLEDYANLSNVGTELPRDSAFGYSERPQVGFLAAAAWRAGGVALEEWGTRKGDETVQSYGRNDLWIRLGAVEWSIEAKSALCDLGRDLGEERMSKDMAENLEQALKDSGKVQTDDKSRMAALFVSAVWHPSRRSDRAAAMDEWKNACKAVDADLTAFVLESGGGEPKWPGLALFLAGPAWKNPFPQNSAC